MFRARTLTLLLSLSFAATGSARADLECELPNDRRQLRVELPGQEHLCEVSVTYQSGERRVLWYADNDSRFCSDKLDELHTKYTETWGFDCGPWPNSDGIDALDADQRRSLDDLLRVRLDGPARPSAVRVATAPSGRDGELIAVQWLAADTAQAPDALSVYLDPSDGGDWQPLLDVDDLTAQLPATAEPILIERALLTGIDEGGALALTTVLDSSDDSRVCRGRQRLALDGAGGLVARTPHRHACEAVIAADAG